MVRGARQQTGRQSHQAQGVPDLGVPRQLKLTPSQMTELVAVEYGSGEEVLDAQLAAALRRIRGRPERSEAQRVVVAAIAVMAAGLVGLRGEGSISMEMGRQKKVGLIPVACVMTAKRDDTSFPSGIPRARVVEPSHVQAAESICALHELVVEVGEPVAGCRQVRNRLDWAAREARREA